MGEKVIVPFGFTCHREAWELFEYANNPLVRVLMGSKLTKSYKLLG